MKQLAILAVTVISLIEAYRLPTNVMPESYRLEIVAPFGEKNNFDFEGKVWIETSCVTPTNNITLHSKGLEIDKTHVRLKDISSKAGKEIKDLKISFNTEHDFLIIAFDQTLTEDHRYEIYIPFKGKLDDSLAGFYRSSYTDAKTKEKKWLGVTQFEAISARRAFPCFDEPAMKATFDISIARKDGYKSISNMPLLSTEPMEDKPGWYWDNFDISVPMSTYLVAYVVSDFHYKEAEPIDNNNVTFRIWSRQDAIDQVDFAKDVGPKALRFYEKFFNIGYPLPKQDMIAIPDFSAGAMENWGLITYRESYLLYDPKVSAKVSQHSVASVIAHELAHQWFGNLVTMKWWTDLWLNEGFATYMASVAVDHLFPQWNSLQEEGATDMLSVFSFDALRSSHPVSVPIGDPKEIDEIFDTISYKKGSSLIRMMSLFLGEETLRAGVSNYLREHRYHNAEQDDLWHSLTVAAHKKNTLPKDLTVKTIMDTWTLQTGYPVIHVERDYKNGSVEITQERFLRDTIKLKGDKKPCWWVPLSYSTESHSDFDTTTPKYWLSCGYEESSQTIEEIGPETEWILFNNKMAGIYKVNYDEKNWLLLSKALKSDFTKIPTLNRVQLLADAADLGYVGHQKYDVFFDMLGYLKEETEYLPWKAALGKADALKNYLIRNPIYGVFKNYMTSLLSPIYEKLGGLAMANEENFDKLDKIKFQVLIVSRSCRYGVEKCIEDAKTMFNKWKSAPNDTNPVPKDLRSAVYCTALKNGGENEWNFLWNKYQQSNVATERNSLLNVLGCTREIWLLSRYLEWSLDDTKIRRQDTSTVFGAVAGNDVGYYIAKKFFFDNVNKIFKHLAPNKRRITRYLTSITSHMQDVDELHELSYLIDHNKENFSEVKQGVEQALETVKINIQWQQMHGKSIHDVLQKFSKI
ncbi:aminopeptidase N [Dendroctonus ponderosae]|uniref:Aminopeptidase n=1 Tax=Dendroctonus ponderosae TaxID=77166 RepID=A0AAR5P4C1_DENPD|nr:aminopeptidase N [Dendroctonus ponderosae]KAH1005675.1 hypothetical protein HUJ04_006613 [Dendroctonus ponderosae]